MKIKYLLVLLSFLIMPYSTFAAHHQVHSGFHGHGKAMHSKSAHVAPFQIKAAKTIVQHHRQVTGKPPMTKGQKKAIAKTIQHHRKVSGKPPIIHKQKQYHSL